jgi:hypothetical protein
VTTKCAAALGSKQSPVQTTRHTDRRGEALRAEHLASMVFEKTPENVLVEGSLPGHGKALEQTIGQAAQRPDRAFPPSTLVSKR